MSIDETLIIFNNYIGEKEFTDNFINILSDNNLNESDGYLIKFKVYNDILSQNVNENNIISYINNLIEQLANKRSYNNHIFDYDYKIIQYLINNEDNKIICENCSEKILFIDKYCYHCGKKQDPQITLFDLLSRINSSDIKPGDIIKINEDYSIDKTSSDNTKSQDKLSDKTESLYTPFNKNETEHKYLKIILLDYINKNKNISSFIVNYPYFKKEDIILTVYELEQENLISKSIKNTVKDYYFSIKNNSRDKFNDILCCEYKLSQNGIYVLDSYPYVLFYYQIIKNTVVDDIVEFDRLCQNKRQNQTFKDITLGLIYPLRDKFFEKKLYNEYYSTYDMEAYIYELFGETNNRIITLFKKFIIKSNHNIQVGLNPLEYDYLKYLVDNIYNLNTDNIQYLFYQAYADLNEDTLIIKENELFDCLIRFRNGESLDNLNFYLNENINC